MDEKELDLCAKANLTSNDLIAYMAYKANLKREGEPWNEISMILTGFIWDTIEYYDYENF